MTRPLLVLVAVSAACSSDLTVPVEAQVSCEAGGRCPEGTTCSPAVGRCVPEDGGDVDPPALVRESVVVEPPQVGLGGSLLVRFSVDEPLDRPPEVGLDLPGRPPLTASSADEGLWTFGHAATGEEPERTVAVLATLVDRVGNVAADVSVGQVTFDFTAPSVAVSRVEPPALRRDAPLEVVLTIDEPLGSPPSVRLVEAGPSLACPERAEPPEVRCTLAPGSAVEERSYGVSVEASDGAGNPARADVADAVRFDDTAPALVGVPEVVPGWAKPGDEVTVAVEVDEPLASAPGVELVRDGDALPLTPAGRVGELWTFSHVASADEEGAWSLRVSGHADPAGNPGAAWTGEDVLVVDATPPAVEGTPAFDKDPAAYRAGEAVTVSFGVSEDLSATPPEVVLGTVPPLGLDCAAGPDAPLAWRCGGPPLSGEESPEGALGLTIRLRDRAGHGSRTDLRLVLDFTPPRTLAAAPDRALYGAGDEVVYTVAVDEPLGGEGAAPALTASRDGVPVPGVLGAPRDRTATTFTFVEPAAAALDGAWEVRLRLEDVAGNVADDVAGAPFAVDGAPPGLLDGPTLGKSPAWYRDGDELDVAFEADEPMAEGWPRARLDTVPALELGCAPVEGLRFRCAAPAPLAADLGPAGDRAVVVELRDPAGNSGLFGAGLTLDFEPPGLAEPPVLARCDGRALASAAGDDLWVDPALSCPGGEAPVTVRFVLDEPTGPGVVPRLLLGGAPAPDAPLLDGAAGGVSFAFGYVPDGSEPETDSTDPDAPGVAVEVEVEDRAGNASRLLLGTLRFDSAPPRPRRGDTALRGVTLVRRPWGSAATGPVPGSELVVEPDAFPEAGLVRVLSVVDRAGAGADPEGLLYRRVELGSGVFEPGAGLQVPLGSEDVPAVHLTLTDRAGNESDADPDRAGAQAVLVQAVEWVASLAPGGDGGAPGPHRLLVAMPLLGQRLAPDLHAAPDDSPDDLAAAAVPGDGLAATATSARAAWWALSHPPRPHPPQRAMHTLVQDPHRSTLLLVGDSDWVPVVPRPWQGQGAVWEWDGRAWAERVTPRAPSPRIEHVLVWDAARRRAVLFGGTGGEALLGDTWTWDGTDWRERHPAHAPSARRLAQAAYDPVRERVVLFGGEGARPLGDTWEWDGEDWIVRDPPTRPEGRYGAAMAWDPAGGVVLLQGAAGGFCHPQYLGCADTWTWDGEDWRRLAPATRPPPGHWQWRLVAAADPRDGGGVLLVHAGEDSTWRWDGADWHLLGPAPGRGALAWDGAREAVALVDTRSRLYFHGDAGWERRTPPPASPPTNQYAGLAADPVRGGLVLYGGFAPGAGADTWTWDGELWSLAREDSPPGRRWGHAMASSPADGGVLVFAGCGWEGDSGACTGLYASTWLLDGAGWRRVDAGASPPLRALAAMAGDPRLDRPGPVLFGGYGAAGSCGGPHNDCSDTWQWHGGAWEQRQPAQVPPARYDAALAAAGGAAGGGILLFGGMHLDPDGFGGVVSSRLGDTWVFDGDDWSEHDPARSPAPRCCAGAAWDAGRDRTVLYGGRADRATDCGGLEEECGDTWEWAGDAWEPRTPLVAPPPLEYPALAWDPDRRGVVLHGGQSTRDGPANGDDWPRSGFSWLYSPERTTPHLLAAFDVGGSGLLAQTAANPADTVLTAVEVSARAGGLGHTPGSREGGGGEPVAGYLLAVGAMGTGGWLPVREADDRPDEGEAWTGVFDRTWSCGEPWCADASIQRWAESDGMLYLDFATRAPQGAVPEPAVVAVDLVEVRLRAWRTGCELAGAHHPEGTPNGAPCDDDDPATAGEVCREGRCVVP